MKESLQYKQIAEKYNLSPEHPGLAVNPTMDSMRLTNFTNLGIGSIFPTSWQKYGPRFFDKPLNEGCVEKALCAAKYVGIFSMFYFLRKV